MTKQIERNKTTGTWCDFARALLITQALFKTEAALRQAMFLKKVPYRKKGGKVYFIEEELQAWLANSDGGVTLEEALSNK